MAKLNMLNDYNYAAHPQILTALMQCEDAKFGSYGLDEQCARAKQMIAAHLEAPQAEIHFLVGGTQTNLTSASAFLRSHEAIIAPASAHISTHETGAIEATGHKVIEVSCPIGKIVPEQVEQAFAAHAGEHMVKPRVLQISQTTEYGTVYSLAELQALRRVCDSLGMLLYIDGARLANALAASADGLSLAAIAGLADAFYIGGTKNGLLFGEALVICNPSLQSDFRYLIKQHGGLLAKGFLMGIQFAALFEDDLFLTIGRQANARASELSLSLKALGYDFAVATESNQVFPIVRSGDIEGLQQEMMFNVWEQVDAERTAIRLICTYRTSDVELAAVLKLMQR